MSTLNIPDLQHCAHSLLNFQISYRRHPRHYNSEPIEKMSESTFTQVLSDLKSIEHDVSHLRNKKIKPIINQSKQAKCKARNAVRNIISKILAVTATKIIDEYLLNAFHHEGEHDKYRDEKINGKVGVKKKRKNRVRA